MMWKTKVWSCFGYLRRKGSRCRGKSSQLHCHYINFNIDRSVVCDLIWPSAHFPIVSFWVQYQKVEIKEKEVTCKFHSQIPHSRRISFWYWFSLPFTTSLILSMDIKCTWIVQNYHLARRHTHKNRQNNITTKH